MKLSSLRLKLTFFISGMLLLACAISTSISYFELQKSLSQIIDSQQVLFAKRLAALSTSAHGKMAKMMLAPEQLELELELEPELLDKIDYDDDVLSFAIFNRRGDMLLNDGGSGRKFKFFGGFFPSENNRAMIHEDDNWRIIWLLSNDNRSIIAVGQEFDYQQELLAKQVIKQLIPWLITFIVVILFVVLIIGRSFKPIRQLADKITTRKLDDDTPVIVDGIPKEIMPFILALNTLFGRISSTIIRERQFISDAAHELRTPLAALRVQTEVAQLSDDDRESRERALNNLLIGIDRSTHLVDQLLTLSRLDTFSLQENVKPVNWVDIIANVIDDLMPFAEKKNIIINVNVLSANEIIQADPLLLSVLTRNIINNAIRYIPEHSTITITIDRGKIYFEDNGLGVSNEVLARLGERFYRPAGQHEKGSGLGLSIVRKIAQIYHISVQFSNKETGGFVVTLILNRN